MPIVKVLDNVEMPELIDHIGWQLWRAAGGWKERFDNAMIAAGYPWFREARARVFSVLDFEGTPQAVLAERLGVTKQAIQQLVDQLVENGYVERLVDPDDARSRIVVYTASGARLMTDANRIKTRLHRTYRRKLGPGAFDALIATLNTLNAP